MRIFLSLALLFSFSVVAQDSTEYKYEVESNKAEYYIGSYKKGKDVEDLTAWYGKFAEWADSKGELGPIYGNQWRSWVSSNGVKFDQITGVIESIKNDPDSRRHVVSAWNVGEIDNMKLPPCHILFQFYVVNNKLSCQLYQRSADIFLGVPFNIASYALLTMMIADQCGLGYGEFIHTFGDAHIYTNHIEQVQQQLKRDFRPLPNLSIKKDINSIYHYVYNDFVLDNYNPHSHIKAKVAI